MSAPAIPDNESERLAALRGMGLLDTPKEERFDRICRIAARHFDMPIVLVTLVDTDRQWFKSCIGLGITSTGRDISFCGHAISEKENLIIPDATQDVRFRDNPLVLGDPFIRFYAGHVLRGPRRTAVGTLCLIDRRARKFSAADQKIHADLAAVVEREMNLSETIALQGQLLAAQGEADRLLRNILPAAVADRLKRAQGAIADEHPEASVLVAVVHDFSGLSRNLRPAEEVELLNRIYSGFDELAERHGVEKIRSLEAGYVAACGLPEARADHLEALADFALAMQALMVRLDPQGTSKLALRIGLDCGPVVAGVIGRSKFSYDIWGDTVDAAWELAQLGIPGCIQVNDDVCRRLAGKFQCETRGQFYLKSKGGFGLHFLRSRETV